MSTTDASLGGAGSMSPFTYATRTQLLRPSIVREILKATESADVISFAGGLPAPELFPAAHIAALCHQILAEDPAGALQYGTTEGHRPLRQAVCDRISASTGLPCDACQVLITTGSQQALDLVARVLLDPGDTVLVEEPSYLGALQAFAASGANIVAVPGDERGMSPESLRRAIAEAAARPKLLYLLPTFHNPTGVTLDAGRRRELAEVAQAAGVPVLEDDPYGPLRYAGIPLPAVVSHVRSSAWIYLGTCSKVLSPGLRVGWLVTPEPELMKRLVAIKQAVDLHTASLNQRVVARFLQDAPAFEAHLQLLAGVYRARRDTMAAAIREHFPSDCAFTVPDGGLFLWVRLPHRFDVDRLFHLALERRVAFVPGSAFGQSARTRQGIRLNFSNADPGRIAGGIRRLGELLCECDGHGVRARPCGR
jgi:2-aminoadipate transaminase